MNAVAPEAGPITIERWTGASLPEGLTPLLAEAAGAGVAWMADFPEDWRRRPFLEAGEGLILALSGGVPLAMAVVSADPHVPGTETGRLRYIYVAQALRGRGLLRVLVAACLERGAPRWRRLRLHTDNPVAARVYEDCGFKARDEHRTTHVRDL